MNSPDPQTKQDVNPTPRPKREKNEVEDYFSLGEMFSYFIRVFKPHKGGQKPGFSLRAMHTINKISIVMFFVGLIFFIVKIVLR